MGNTRLILTFFALAVVSFAQVQPRSVQIDGGTGRVIGTKDLKVPRGSTFDFESGSALKVGGIPIVPDFAISIDSRIAGKNPVTDRALYSSQVHTGTPAYVRNPNCWAADIDLTCVSVWNSHFGVQGGGVLLSPRHILLAEHFFGASGTNPVPNGTTFRFITRDNQIVDRTIISKARVESTDICIGLLNSDVTASINFAKVLPSSFNNSFKLNPGNLPIPVLVTDQTEKASVLEYSSSNGAPLTSFDPQRLSFAGTFALGDSGNPVLAIMGNQPVALGLVQFISGGFDYPLYAYLAEINAVMTSLGGGYQVAPIDPAPFTSQRDIVGSRLQIGSTFQPSASIIGANSDYPALEVAQNSLNGTGLRVTSGLGKPLDIVGFGDTFADFMVDADVKIRIQTSGAIEWPGNFAGARATRENLRLITKRKAATTSRTNNTILADPDLQLAVGSGEHWAFDFFCRVNLASGAPDFNAGIALPTASAIYYGVHAHQNVTILMAEVNVPTASGGLGFNVGGAAEVVYRITGYVVTSAAGTISLNWAQQTTDAAATSIIAGSYAIFTRLD